MSRQDRAREQIACYICPLSDVCDKAFQGLTTCSKQLLRADHILSLEDEHGKMLAVLAEDQSLPPNCYSDITDIRWLRHNHAQEQMLKAGWRKVV